MKNITDHLTQPISIVPGKVTIPAVMYVYSDAYLNCDCGKQMKLTVRRYGSDTYEGCCECGKKYSMFLNELREVAQSA